MHKVVNEKLVAINGEGGIIGVDAQGNFALLFNSEGMYRGVKTSDGLNEVSHLQVIYCKRSISAGQNNF